MVAAGQEGLARVDAQISASLFAPVALRTNRRQQRTYVELEMFDCLDRWRVKSGLREQLSVCQREAGKKSADDWPAQVHDANTPIRDTYRTQVVAAREQLPSILADYSGARHSVSTISL